ncbi:BTB/POZ domain-containing protein 18 isoform X3 [Paramormyrops kingsleyae]|uniref:BTB/POZ domain-containing protein 18 isoform X3 n=1 Tax=Paramormyrops kingsleyae TaxID=1676925 RepID=UPI003B96E028
MWRYRKPSFELLLLGELQKQQRSSILCDTILQADGISVPAHSCVLSAISPQFSRTFSAAPPLPLGQSHLLQFQAVRAHTLLKLVGFLYSGELEGSGERERKELITAAWKLGIEGLEEVGRKEGEVQEKHNGRVTEDAKHCEDDSGEVQELGRRWEESEGLIEQADGTRGPGEDQDMNTESSYVPLSKKARDSETQTELAPVPALNGAGLTTSQQDFPSRYYPASSRWLSAHRLGPCS